MLNIPRILHRIWFGPGPIPERYEGYWSTWEQLHPGWEMHTWTYDNLPELTNQETFDNCGEKWPALSHTHDGVEQEVQRADIASYDIINQYGGVYLNCDMEPHMSIEPFITGATAFAGWERRGFLGNAIFGAIAGHPFIKACVDAIPDRCARRDWEMERQTGPYLITSIWRQGHELTILHDAYNGGIATHHQGHQIAWH